MDEIHVTGKASLSGEIFIQGSKNAALPISGGKTGQSPKGIRKNGGLDVKAAERQAKVQKEQVRKS